MKQWVAGGVLCLIVMAVPAAQSAKYGVTVVEDKKADYAAFKTYSWSGGQPSPNPSVDKMIVAAIDKELKGVGLTKVDKGPSDVLVNYAALRRNDVDVNAKPGDSGQRAQFAVGTVVFSMLEPKARTRLLGLRLDKPIETDSSKAEATIGTAIAELFEKYPTKKK